MRLFRFVENCAFGVAALALGILVGVPLMVIYLHDDLDTTNFTRRD